MRNECQHQNPNTQKCCGTCKHWEPSDALYNGVLWGQCGWPGIVPSEWYIDLTSSEETGGTRCPCHQPILQVESGGGTLIRIEFHANTEAFAGLRFEREVAAVLSGIASRIENGKHTRKVYDSDDVEIGEFNVMFDDHQPKEPNA